jgi:hypothetical protein
MIRSIFLTKKIQYLIYSFRVDGSRRKVEKGIKGRLVTSFLQRIQKEIDIPYKGYIMMIIPR